MAIRCITSSYLSNSKKMLRFLTLAVIVLLNAFAAESVGVISEQGVDPSEIDYKNATTVLLKNVKITEIPKNYFRELNLDLSLLKITNSRLVRIDEEAFDGLDHLNLLELSNDEITKFEPKTFTRLKGLELLQLKSNKLRDVSLVLNHVQEIVLAFNRIEELGEDFLTGDSVTFIDLRGNRLKHLKHSMKHLNKLARIYIGNNQIARIEPAVFGGNDNLVGIYAPENMLTSTEGLRLTQLKTLDLSSNRLAHLDNESFPNMFFLDELLLSGNQIDKIGEDTFKDTKNLQFLDLSDNKISEIDPKLFGSNLYLMKLRLSKNRLTELKPFATKLRHLRVLELSHNNLRFIDSKFFESVEKLEILDLSFNKLTELGHTLAPLANLVNLDLSSNQLHFDRNTTRFNHKLSHLNVSSNGLDLSLSYLQKNSDLKFLDLSRNNISHFCDVEPNMEGIASIDLSYNQIRELNCFKNSNLLPFAVIDIGHNPFTCDSSFDDVIAHFVSVQSSPYRVQSFNIKDVRSATHSIKTSLSLWNGVKRELCPDGLDIPLKRVCDEDMDNDQKGEDDSEDSYGEQYWSGDYYYDVLLTPDVKDLEQRESTEAPNDENFQLDIEVEVKESPGHVHRVIEQSERESWDNINQVKNIVEESEEERSDILDLNNGQFRVFTISLILLGIAVVLILTNAAIFIYLRMKGLKKDFRGLQKYTHLENKVYKDTTMPNDYSEYGGRKSENNYRINCARMFTNFGVRGNEDDTESVKKMIVDTGIKADV